MSSDHSRYVEVSRRALLKGFTAAAVAGSVAACSSNDKAALQPTAAPAGSAAPSGGTGGQASGPLIPASARLKVNFTFTQGQSQGPTRNPYIAVWLENGSEQLVKTISLWHLQGRDDNWLKDMKRWVQVDGNYETPSSATKVPGSYTVEWDGIGPDGTKVLVADYWLCIEAAREHGPYELIREKISLGTAPMKRDLTPNGELTAASVEYTV